MLANKLTINYDKTHYMIFTPSHHADPNLQLDLFINSNQISKVSTIKYLGVHLDESLSGKSHIYELCLCLRKFIGIFYKLSLKLPPHTLKILYFSFIYPHILYGIEVYANTYLTYLHDLIVLNNRILRILQRKKFNCNTNELYRSYNTLPIDKLFHFQILQHAHTLLFNPSSLPNFFQANCQTNNSIHSHYTRSTQDFHRFSCFSSFGRRLSFNLCAKLWNSLPLNIKSLISTNLFKRDVRKFLSIDAICSV